MGLRWRVRWGLKPHGGRRRGGAMSALSGLLPPDSGASAGLTQAEPSTMPASAGGSPCPPPVQGSTSVCSGLARSAPRGRAACGAVLARALLPKRLRPGGMPTCSAATPAPAPVPTPATMPPRPATGRPPVAVAGRAPRAAPGLGPRAAAGEAAVLERDCRDEVGGRKGVQGREGAERQGHAGCSRPLGGCGAGVCWQLPGRPPAPSPVVGQLPAAGWAWKGTSCCSA